MGPVIYDVGHAVVDDDIVGTSSTGQYRHQGENCKQAEAMKELCCSSHERASFQDQEATR